MVKSRVSIFFYDRVGGAIMEPHTKGLANKMTKLQELLHSTEQAFDTQISHTHAWRMHQLSQLEALLQQETASLSLALQQDLGKSAIEAWSSEIGFLLADIRYQKRHLRSWMKPRTVSSPLAMHPARSTLTPKPIGVVLVLGAWNYPLQLSLGPAIAAIAAGNAVIIKPSEYAAHTSALLAKLLPQYLDIELIHVVEGAAEVAQELTALPFHHIFYTGGAHIARHVMTAAAKHLTPVTLELGGKSPAFITRHAPLRQTAERLVWGKFLNAGQTCIAPDYILVERSVHAQLVQELQQATRRFYGADPAQSPDYSRIIHAQHFQRLTRFLTEYTNSTDKQAKIIGGHHQLDDLYIEPTFIDFAQLDCLDAPVLTQSAIMQEEVFGPILPILPMDNLQQGIKFVRSRPHPLACYAFTTNKQEQHLIEQTISCGSLCFNDTLVFMLNPKLPFGGIGASGQGRYHGKWGFDTLSHLQPTVKRSFRLDHPLRYPPFTLFKQRLLKRLIR